MMQLETMAADAAVTIPASAGGEAFYELGLRCAAGQSAPADLVAAHKWLNIAVAKGFRAAAERRAELAHEMSAQDVAAAQREARVWLTRH